ncbi:MAG: xylose isomerase [Candidatus Aminicenantes bacterium]|nr:xylose isomerase [Candidatus Aminicenantes bacterium]
MDQKPRDLSYQKKAVDPNVILKNLKKDLDIQVSVGIWYFTPGGGRFHDRFIEEASIPQRIEMAAGMAELGIKGIEAHYPDEINEENIGLYKKLEEETGIRIAGIPFSHFFDKMFEFGSLSNPDGKVRDKAREIAVGGLRMVKEAGAEMAISWPGMDGYRYLHGKPFMHMWELFEGTLAEAMDEVPGVRVAIEPKAYEPAPNNIYRTTAEGILAARRIEEKLQHPENRRLLKSGTSLVGLNPEVGHVKMSYEILPATFSLVAMEGRLAHTHWNSQPDGNYDQDNNIGVVNFQETEALLYALWGIGYKEFFGIDINPENMPVEKAVKLNLKALDKMKNRIGRLPHERILECYMRPEEHRGELEDIILENW